MATRGFTGRGRYADSAGRLPPGQFVTEQFPVLSAGPTPQIALDTWRLTLERTGETVKAWSWEEFNRLPMRAVTRDIHCVTRWSKFDTEWSGVSFQDLLADAGLEPPTPYAMARSFEGYSTNLPVKDLVEGHAMVAISYAGRPISPQHGGPARLLVPHLYFWKSAKWLKSIEFIEADRPGFWEERGYHMYGDPWREQRYSND